MFTISCTSLTLREAVGESRVEIRVIAAGGDFIVFVSHPIQ